MLEPLEWIQSFETIIWVLLTLMDPFVVFVTISKL